MKKIDWCYWITMSAVALALLWAACYAYLDVKMKWNLAHIKSCPCLVEVQK